MRHGLHILVVVEFRHHLASLDRVGEIDVDALDAPGHFRRDDELRPGLERAAESPLEFHWPALHGGDLHRHRSHRPLAADRGPILLVELFKQEPADRPGDQERNGQ